MFFCTLRYIPVTLCSPFLYSLIDCYIYNLILLISVIYIIWPMWLMLCPIYYGFQGLIGYMEMILTQRVIKKSFIRFDNSSTLYFFPLVIFNNLEFSLLWSEEKEPYSYKTCYIYMACFRIRENFTWYRGHFFFHLASQFHYQVQPAILGVIASVFPGDNVPTSAGQITAWLGLWVPTTIFPSISVSITVIIVIWKSLLVASDTIILNSRRHAWGTTLKNVRNNESKVRFTPLILAGQCENKAWKVKLPP